MLVRARNGINALLHNELLPSNSSACSRRLWTFLAAAPVLWVFLSSAHDNFGGGGQAEAAGPLFLAVSGLALLFTQVMAGKL
jgi:hypothetical protein